MHKHVLIKILAGTIISIAAASANAVPIALSVTVQGSANCGPDQSHGITSQSIYRLAADTLTRKGYQVVDDYRKVPGGKEVAIAVMYCQALGGQYNAYSGTAGLYAIANGTSAASNGNRVAYKYSAANVGTGGDDSQDIAGSFRKNMNRQVQIWIEKSF